MCAHASSAGERGYQRHAASVARPDIITMTITVAIIGRPNVGKSTLFNRLVGQRLALVDDEPGVTRDRREGDAHLLGLELRVVDTPGLEERFAPRLSDRHHQPPRQHPREADLPQRPL